MGCGAAPNDGMGRGRHTCRHRTSYRAFHPFYLSPINNTFFILILLVSTLKYYQYSYSYSSITIWFRTKKYGSTYLR